MFSTAIRTFLLLNPHSGPCPFTVTVRLHPGDIVHPYPALEGMVHHQYLSMVHHRPYPFTGRMPVSRCALKIELGTSNGLRSTAEMNVGARRQRNDFVSLSYAKVGKLFS